MHQQVQQYAAVLPAGHPHGDAVAVRDEVEIADGAIEQRVQVRWHTS
jgi:hypothetical protein